MAIIPEKEKKTQNEVTATIRGYVTNELKASALNSLKAKYPEIPKSKDYDTAKIDEFIENVGALVATNLLAILEGEGIKTKGNFVKDIDGCFESDFKDELYNCIFYHLEPSKEYQEYTKADRDVRNQADEKTRELLFQYEIGNIDGSKLEKEVKEWTPTI